MYLTDIYLSIYTRIYLSRPGGYSEKVSDYMKKNLPVYLSIYPSIYLSFYPSFYLSIYLSRPEEYKKKVSDYVKKYATEDALRDPAQVKN